MSYEESVSLPDDWELTTVDQLVRSGALARPMDGNHGGIHPKASDYVEHGIPFVMASDLKGSQVDLSNCKFISEAQARNLRKGFAQAGDVLLSHKATIGRTAIIQESEYPFLMLTPQVTYYRVLDAEKLIPNYLKAYFDSHFFQSILALWAGAGSTRAYLGIAGQLRLPVIVPPIGFQKLVAAQAEALDGKIQLNHQINQTLEQIAQAIFKSWFVDFEPVKAKIATLAAGGSEDDALLAAMQVISGHALWDTDTPTANAAAHLTRLQTEQPEQYAELRATAELFPSAMQNSELGEIPEGWEVSTIGAEVEVKGGGTPPTKNNEYWDEGSVHWSSPKDLSNSQSKVMISTERKITNAGLARISSGLLPVDTVLMSSRAPVGYLAMAKIPLAINQGYIAMICKKRLRPEYVIQWADSVMNDIKQRASGTTFAEISKKNFRQIPVVVPTAGLVLRYSDIVRTQYSAIELNLRNSNDLSEIRDSLLPKLLSGELEV